MLLGFGDSYGSGEGNPAGTMGSAISAAISAAIERGSWSLSAITNGVLRALEAWWWDFVNVNGVQKPKYHDLGVDAELVSTSWICHRSSDSGIAKAVDRLLIDYSFGIKFGHFACSGAKSNHIVADAYAPKFFFNPASVPTQIAQANAWLERQRIPKKDVDAVVVSIGGNDVGFSDVIYDCFIEAGDCYNESDTVALRDGAPNKIRNAVDRVVQAVQNEYVNAQIVFTSYTDGISVNPSNSNDLDRDGVCSYDDDPWLDDVEYDDDEFWDILPVDSRFVRSFMDVVNSSLESAVSERVNVSIARNHFVNFRNNGFCTRNNRNIVFNSEAISRQGADQYGGWSSGGWHPNDLGYRLYGDSIVSKLQELFAARFALSRR